MRAAWKLLTVLLILFTFADVAYANRWKEALEEYELSSLEFLYVDLKHKCGPRATIKNPAGYLHAVTIGNMIGKNSGRIVEITADAVRIIEVRQDSDGEWREKSAFIPRRI
jgi:Tfp pilus assembly protein PilP